MEKHEPRPQRIAVRRPVPNLLLWPGDEVEITTTGAARLVHRDLPEDAIAELREAAVRGDLAPLPDREAA